MHKAAILTIGDEILIGQTVDTNSAWIGKELSLIGYDLVQILSVPDKEVDILRGLKFLEQIAEVIIITGGLGPTKDDITKQVLADYFQTKLVYKDFVFEHIVDFLKQVGRKPTEGHRRQAFVPDTAQLLDNEKGTAPGMVFRKGDKLYFSLPGVPYEMKNIYRRHLSAMLLSGQNGIEIRHHTLQTIGTGESKIEAEITDIVENFPSGVSIAYLPHLARVKLRISSRGTDADRVEGQLLDAVEKLKERLGNRVFGEGETRLEKVVGEMLKDRGLTLSTAESCTGGRIASLITSIPGSSDYFNGSIVSYANEMKMNVLGVSEETLRKHGAVSEQTVIAMVKGACSLCNSDIAVATSGVAGPGGGSKEKPVGTVWLACGNDSRIETKKLQLTKHRSLNIEASSDWALNMVRLFLSPL
jgi:nicotinamide-nucleotide amidase